MNSYASIDIPPEAWCAVSDAAVHRSASQVARVVESEEENDAMEIRERELSTRIGGSGQIAAGVVQVPIILLSPEERGISWILGGSLETFLVFPRRATTLFTPFLIVFLKLFQELEPLSFLENLGESEKEWDAQGSGASAPLREQGEDSSGERETGEGGGRIRCRTGKVQGT